MKTNKGSFTQRACQRQARWACRAGRFRDAGLTQFLFSLCAGWAILIGSDHLLETDVNDWKQTAATGSNRWFFRRFLRRRRIAQAKDNGKKRQSGDWRSQEIRRGTRGRELLSACAAPVFG
jgi:hypothetical protein